MKKFTALYFIVLSLVLSASSLEAKTTTLSSDQEISSEIFGSDDAEFTLLWLHSERGINANLRNTLKSIATEQSIRIILPDFHESYFMPVSRYSLNEIPQQDVADLIERIGTELKDKSANKKLYILAMSRFAGMALKAAQHLQIQKKNPVAGIMLLAPYLQTQTPEIGTKATYQAITSQSNLPLYLFQAERSPRYIPLPKLVKSLEKGGSPLFVHVFKNVHGGFQQRDLADLRELDIKALKKFPKHIYNALTLLSDTDAAEFNPHKNKPETLVTKNTASKTPAKKHGLQKVILKTPELQLNDLKANKHNLSDYKGKTVIVSFWASWCRPCLEEMPSLVKLKDTYKDKLEILGVNIREDKEIIQHFTKEMGINFPILQDMSSKSVEDWRVYVYPSNFIIDKTGKLRYAATGTLDWQDKDITDKLQNLMNEN